MPRPSSSPSRLLRLDTRRLVRSGSALVLAVLAGALLWDILELWNVFDRERQVSYVPFFIGLALLPLVGVPTTPLFIIAGIAFTPVAAIAGCALSIAANLAISYWLANRWLRRPIRRQMRKWNIKWPEHDPTQALHFLFLVRLTPGVPTFVKNYATALSEISFITYLSVSWLITFAYAIGFVIMGDSLVNHSTKEAFIGIFILVVGFVIVRRARRKNLKITDEIAAEHKLAPSQVTACKKELFSEGCAPIERKKARNRQSEAEQERQRSTETSLKLRRAVGEKESLV
ncbi:MAG: putative membrane protein YdjX (TVP38/TMEM64 family) [Verrucomicrobiales bacterium]|jgi:uncharacterized membrane protein YdjX (TVP38/TMEM64 family)